MHVESFEHLLNERARCQSLIDLPSFLSMWGRLGAPRGISGFIVRLQFCRYLHRTGVEPAEPFVRLEFTMQAVPCRGLWSVLQFRPRFVLLAPRGSCGWKRLVAVPWPKLLPFHSTSQLPRIAIASHSIGTAQLARERSPACTSATGSMEAGLLFLERWKPMTGVNSDLTIGPGERVDWYHSGYCAKVCVDSISVDEKNNFRPKVTRTYVEGNRWY